MERLQKPLNVRVPPQMLDDINAAAARHGMLRTEYVTQVLDRALAMDRQQQRRQEFTAGYSGVPEL